MNTRKDYTNEPSAPYFPNNETRERMQRWIKDSHWYVNRQGRQIELTAAIVKDCGYSELPKKPKSFCNMVYWHIAEFFGIELAKKFKIMNGEI